MKRALPFIALASVLAACTPTVNGKDAHLSAQTVHTQANAALAGDWNVIGLSNNGRSVPLDKNTKMKIIVQNGELLLRTQPGCNALIAELRPTNGKWKSNGISSTRMLCEGSEAVAERFATVLLNESLTLRSTARELRLIGKSGEFVLRR